MLAKLYPLPNKIPEKHLSWLLAFAGALLACWVIYHEHGRINNDAVLYLEVARLFVQHEWQAGFTLYNWPLYPLLIALTHQATGFSLQSAAYLLSICFFALATYSLTTLIREAGGSRHTVFAGALLLFGSTYITADILPMIVRDQGFWAFFLSGLLYFLRFYRRGYLRDALLWQICAIIAVLFRIEGITFLALTPLVILTNRSLNNSGKLLYLAMAYIIPTLSLLTLAFILLTHPEIKLADIGRLEETLTVLQRAYARASQGLVEKAHLMGDSVLGSFLSDYAMGGLLLTLLWIVIGKIAGTAGWLSFGLLAIAKKLDALTLIDANAKRILYWTAALAMLNICVILLSNFLLPGRIAVPLALIIIILASFSLGTIWAGFRPGKALFKKHLLFYLVAAILSFKLIQNLVPDNKDRNHQQDAVAWIKQNTPSGTKIFYDDARLRFYAGAPYEGRQENWESVMQLIDNDSLSRYDYLVIHISRKHPEREEYLLNKLHFSLVKKFTTRSGNSIVIIRPSSDTAKAGKVS